MKRVTALVTIALVAAPAALTAGGAVQAVAPVKKAKVVSCVDKRTGAVRFLPGKKTHCRKGEKKVVLNKRGPQGERGPSAAYVANRADVKSLNQMQVGPNTLLSLNLPAGSYVITATTSVRATTANTTITCGLLSATGQVTAASAQTDSATLTPVSLTGTVVTTGPATVALQCQPSADAPAIGLGEAHSATLVALQVGEVSGP